MADEVPFLYHYTSLKGLRGILSTRQIWATDILYLNDSAEFIFTINLLRTILKEEFKLIEELF